MIMIREHRRWNDLQSRWAAGEALSAEEEQERASLAADDLARRRELDLTVQLKQFVDAGDQEPVAPEFVSSVMARLHGRGAPHLRLVTPPLVHPTSENPPPTAARRFVPGRWWVLLPGAIAAASLALWLQARSEKESVVLLPPPANRAVKAATARSELVFASGEVRIDRALPSLGQKTLAGGERIETGKGRACLTVEPKVDVCLAEATRVVVESLRDDDVIIRVEVGTAVAALGPRAPGHTFSLTDGDVKAVAHGTIFSLTKSKSGSLTQVTVVEGRVEVSGAKTTTTSVRAHSELEVARDGGQKSTAISRSHEAQFLSLVAPRELWQSGELGIVSIGQQPDGSQVTIGEEGPFALPVKSFVPAGPQRLVVRNTRGEEGLIDVEVRAGETQSVDAASSRPGTEKGASKPSSKGDAELLAEARNAMSRGDSPAALAAYRRLMAQYPNSAAATTVLVTVGKLELRQNSPTRALRAFDSYLSRGGPLVPEALSGKIRALRALGRTDDERAAIQRYLRQYPGGFEAVALKKRLELLSSQ